MIKTFSSKQPHTDFQSMSDKPVFDQSVDIKLFILECFQFSQNLRKLVLHFNIFISPLLYPSISLINVVNKNFKKWKLTLKKSYKQCSKTLN